MHAAVLATLPSTAARAYTLTVGGNDLNVTGESGAAYMVDIDSIDVTEARDGGSSMSFRVWDPNKEVVVYDGLVVEFWDNTNTRPLFGGFVQSWKQGSATGGRWLDVECAGFDVLLRWLVVGSLTIPSGTWTNAAIQSAAANCFGVGFPLRAFSQPGLGGFQGNQAQPIAACADVVNLFTLSQAVVLDGQTLAEAIDLILEASILDSYFGADLVLTYGVDVQAGLRVYATKFIPTDYADLTVSDTSGQAVTVLDHEQGSRERSVYVKGGNAVGSGVVGDGTGVPGETAIINDSNITTALGKQLAGVAYLLQRQTPASGSLSIGAWQPSGNIRAGSRVTITNAAAGLVADRFRIIRITKKWLKSSPVKETWGIDYGTQRASAVTATSRVSRKIVRS